MAPHGEFVSDGLALVGELAPLGADEQVLLFRRLGPKCFFLFFFLFHCSRAGERGYIG
jgi:hypothetical protein